MVKGFAACIAWIALVPLASCGIRQKGPSSSSQPGQPARSEPCPFEPVAIDIHPLTRLVSGGEGKSWIDAHIEFRDAAGDEVKGSGRLVLELQRESGPVSGMGERDQLLRWESDLTDMRENSRAFDRVTRTYRFELSGIGAAELSVRRLVLRAVLTPPGGRPLEDEMTIGR